MNYKVLTLGELKEELRIPMDNIDIFHEAAPVPQAMINGYEKALMIDCGDIIIYAAKLDNKSYAYFTVFDDFWGECYMDEDSIKHRLVDDDEGYASEYGVELGNRAFEYLK